MRFLIAAGAALAVGATVSLVPVSRALACTCVAFTEEEALERADVVFDGVVASSSYGLLEMFQSSGDPVEYSFSVERTLKGDLSSQVVVTTALISASCGVEFQVGERWRVFASSESGGLQAGLCGGSRLLDDSAPIPSPADDADPQAGFLLRALLGFGVIGTLLATVLLMVRGQGRG